MNASNRNALALALAAALLSPAVSAQGVGKGPPDIPRVAPVPSVSTTSPEQTMRDVKPQTTEQAEQTLNEAPPPSPPQSQGAEHAASHSSVVQRDIWTRLDTDGDGRISTTEGATDTGFNAGFAAMDADHDGFVTDNEYRSSAKADMERGRTSADASWTTSSSLGDTMRRLDTNSDGSISASEGDVDASFKTNFAAIDSNSDGAVTRSEYQAWLKANKK